MTGIAHTRPIREVAYILLSFTLWLVVEYITVWHAKLAEWMALMPFVLVQYLVIILVFWFFIFRRHWDEKRILLLMVVVMYGMEFLWANPLLLNPWTFVPVSIFLTSVWGFLTFMPLWVVQGQLRQRKAQALACLLFLPLGFVLAVILG